MKTVRLVLVVFTLCASEAQAEVTLPPLLQDVGFDQMLDQQVPLDLTFQDESGKSVQLSAYFHGQPVILVLAYYRCPMLCNLVLNGLTQAMRDLPFDVGEEFEVVTVSFDPRETPQLAAAKKETYVSRYGRPSAESGWHFLTGRQEAIDPLCRAVGFRYQYDAKRDEFAHASGIVVLTPGGNVSRYFYDVKYSPRDVRLGLVEASHNRIGSPVDQVLLFCFHYDPAEGKYGAAVMRLVRVGGLVTLILVLAGLWWLFRSRPQSRPALCAGGDHVERSPREPTQVGAASAENRLI